MMLLASIGAPKRGGKKYDESKHRRLKVIELKLFPPTPNSYPHFDYAEITKKLALPDSDDGEDASNYAFRDRDAEEIVKRLEAKYVSGVY